MNLVKRFLLITVIILSVLAGINTGNKEVYAKERRNYSGKSFIRTNYDAIIAVDDTIFIEHEINYSEDDYLVTYEYENLVKFLCLFNIAGH